MMATVRSAMRRVLCAGILLVVSGCRSETTEETLIGKWNASTTGVGRALKIKSDHPNANSTQIVAAARLLSATTMELETDAKFSLVYGANTFAGSWNFDKERG